MLVESGLLLPRLVLLHLLLLFLRRHVPALPLSRHLLPLLHYLLRSLALPMCLLLLHRHHHYPFLVQCDHWSSWSPFWNCHWVLYVAVAVPCLGELEWSVPNRRRWWRTTQSLLLLLLIWMTTLCVVIVHNPKWVPFPRQHPSVLLWMIVMRTSRLVWMYPGVIRIEINVNHRIE